MTQEEIIEGNKIIAKFFNLKKEEFIGYDVSIFMHSKSCRTLTEDLHFHKDWCWLMPIVEKIESIYDEHHGYFGVYISSNTCTIQGTNLHLAIKNLSKYGSVYYREVILDSKIESTWYSVVEFIKWYNGNIL